MNDELKLQALKDFLYTKKLGVWTVKDILAKVKELYVDIK